MIFDFLSCGCGASEPDEEEVERIVRESEEDDEPIPIELPERIAVPAWPVRKEEEVEVERV